MFIAWKKRSIMVFEVVGNNSSVCTVIFRYSLLPLALSFTLSLLFGIFIFVFRSMNKIRIVEFCAGKIKNRQISKIADQTNETATNIKQTIYDWGVGGRRGRERTYLKSGVELGVLSTEELRDEGEVETVAVRPESRRLTTGLSVIATAYPILK
jgi:hypothetical protein